MSAQSMSPRSRCRLRGPETNRWYPPGPDVIPIQPGTGPGPVRGHVPGSGGQHLRGHVPLRLALARLPVAGGVGRGVRGTRDPQPVDLGLGLDRARRPHDIGHVLDRALAERDPQPLELVDRHGEPRLSAEFHADPLVRETRGAQGGRQQLARAVLERRVRVDPEPEVLARPAR